MRKFIVKYFALDYFSMAFGRKLSFTRSAAIIYPLGIINGILALTFDDGFNPLQLITLIPLAIAVFISFIYLRIKPVKFEELDIIQKWQYNQAIVKGVLVNVELTEQQIHEIMEANDYVENTLIHKRFYKPFLWIFFPPIIIALSLIATLLIVKS